MRVRVVQVQETVRAEEHGVEHELEPMDVRVLNIATTVSGEEDALDGDIQSKGRTERRVARRRCAHPRRRRSRSARGREVDGDGDVQVW